jgi:hypothetical protein
MRSVARDAIAQFPIGEPVEIHPRMRAITFEVIMRAVLASTDGRSRRNSKTRCASSSAYQPAGWVRCFSCPRFGSISDRGARWAGWC